MLIFLGNGVVMVEFWFRREMPRIGGWDRVVMQSLKMIGMCG